MPAFTRSTVFLTRHGLSEHNLNTRYFMGRSPPSRLTEQGREQARRLAARLAADARVRHVVASSLPRALETAQIVAGRLGLASLHSDDAFWELSKGEWEGRMPRDGVPAEVQRRLAEDPLGFQYPGGESLAQVEQRVAPAFWRWCTDLQPGGILFVLHGDVICALLHHLLRFPAPEIRDFLVAPCSLTELERQGDAVRLVRFNEAAGG
jgi:broad specificity phosphatase PhoE